LLEKGDLAAIQAVFEECDFNARGGYAKGTALMLRGCTPELTRWLVAQGTDLAAMDDYENTALHAQARNRGDCVDTLIGLGADVNLNTGNAGTPLHCAADSKRAAHVSSLLKRGAQVNAQNRERLTPLEYALQRTSNIDLESMAEVARLLLDAGADKTARCREFVEKLGTTFEFHRAAFDKETLPAADQALTTLYELLGVTPVPRRSLHDGKSRIKVSATAWQKQFDELWDLLVPSGGAAATIQGEVIRIAGRLGNEIIGNGGMNWDRDFNAMTHALAGFLRSGKPLAATQIGACDAILGDVIRDRDGDLAKLTELAVAWVLLNPEPVALPAPAYTR
jgi:hypothetical protein